MNVVIAGGRDFTNIVVAYSCIAELVTDNDTIISGHASGADTIGELYAKDHNLKCKLYPADWGKYGRSAGPIRNEQMAKIADKVIVFWDGKSRGTKNMINMTKKHGCELIVFDYHGNKVFA